MAAGWKILSVFGSAFVYKTMFTAYNSIAYGPVVSAFLRKYGHHAKGDRFEIHDRKREFYEIDTSQYMNYTFDDLGHEYHANHGPQPVTKSFIFNVNYVGRRSYGQHMVGRSGQVP